jgi:hypothetical protein
VAKTVSGVSSRGPGTAPDQTRERFQGDLEHLAKACGGAVTVVVAKRSVVAVWASAVKPIRRILVASPATVAPELFDWIRIQEHRRWSRPWGYSLLDRAQESTGIALPDWLMVVNPQGLLASPAYASTNGTPTRGLA